MTTQRTKLVFVVIAMLSLLSFAASASAEGQASLYYGRAGINIVPVASFDTFGGSIGFFTGPIGIELALEHMPLGGINLGIANLGASMTNVMGNGILQIPIGRVQPYGTVGYGGLYGRAGLDPFLTGGWTRALNYGGGAKIFVTERIGFRVDYRRFVPDTEALPDANLPFTDASLNLDPDFDRITGGVVFRF